MTNPFPVPAIYSGLGEIAESYDVILCDVWGVLHDGRSAHSRAIEALQRFRGLRGPVILLSNAPRPAKDLRAQFERLAVPEDCYDAILTSGMLAREDLACRSAARELKILHLGPERDRGIFESLPVVCVEAGQAELVLCTGLFDDDHETPDDYRDVLRDAEGRGLEFLCANPDILVQRGGALVYCAGALARLYETLGGRSVYYGKPYAPIYAAALEIAGKKHKRPQCLAIGDGLETDIRGANAAGIDAVFIADGVHGENIPEVTSGIIASLCAEAGVTARGAMRALVW
ncbi:MAG TPA: TIGR01459 family HAD-type hydrolase [Rhizomicrobium sp.]|jgi:HAD superfamily hydrolase (TIGR01459 family)